jgi:threonine dehydratase
MEYLGRELWRAEERFFVHPFDHPDVWAGHGTCGLEILEDLPDVRMVLVPVGGGGLIAGVASAVKALAPEVRVIGVQAAAVAPWVEALSKGRPGRVASPGPTIADGINVPTVFPGTWSVAGKLLDGCVAVTEAEIRQAMRLLAAGNRVVAEGAGAVSVAAALKADGGDVARGAAVAVVSGGNLDPTLLAEVLAGSGQA